MFLEREKVLLYGKGEGIKTITTKNNFFQSIIDVLAIVDKDYIVNEYVTIFGIRTKVINLNMVSQFDWSKIIITSSKYYNEIKKEIINENIGNTNQIVSIDEYLIQRFCAGNSELDCIYDVGIDIGGPSKIFNGIYDITNQCDIVNYSKENTWGVLGEKHIFKNIDLGDVYICEATDLFSISEAKYDYVLSSNNLEHIANPIKALKEWKRILKLNGILVIAVPDKKYTFDHKRDIVSYSHLVTDYEKMVGEGDMTHLNEILKLHDLTLDIEAGSYNDFYKRSLDNINNRCLHHHVFNHEVLEKLAEYICMKVIISNIVYKGNDLIILKKVQ